MAHPIIKHPPLAFKILGVCATFLIPIAFLMYVSITAYKKDVNFAKYELYGIRYIRPLMHLLQHLPNYQFIALMKGDTTEEAAKIETAFRDLAQAQDEVGEALQFNPAGLTQRKREHHNLSTLLAKWGQLKSKSVLENPELGREIYGAMITDIRTMITHAGDTSNLILDPDLDSYYLMDVVLLALPDNQDRLQQIQASILALMQRGKMTREELLEIHVWAALLQKSDRERMVADITSVLNEDENFYGKDQQLQRELGKSLDDYIALLQPVIEQLRGAARRGEIAFTPSQFQGASAAARREGLNFWNTAAGILENLLRTRIASYKAKENEAIAISLACLLALIAFSLLIVRRLVRDFARITDRIIKESTALAEITTAVDGAAQQLSSSAAQQAAAIQETVASMEEMTAMLAQTSKNSESCLQITEAGRNEAETGKTIVQRMNSAMDEIRISNSKLESLINLIAEIQAKTKVINDIVFDTRLLSFNASIEAARAGIHGKGFAVVAEEVGKLAAMSGKAADEIRSLLENSSREVSSVVKSTQERVTLGVTVAEEAARNFIVVGSSMENISSAVSNITTATKEQESGVRQTNISMTEMDSLTQKNSGHAESLAMQASRLEEGTFSLRKAIQEMRLLVLGWSEDADLAAVIPMDEAPRDSMEIPDMTRRGTAGRKKPRRSDGMWKAS